MNGLPLVLIILDGWGVAPANRGNAISLANTPMFDDLVTRYPTFALQASGEAVGLPWGEMGNSEVGHMNLGAGKIIYQDLPRITKAVLDGSFFSNAALQEAIAHVRERKSALHLAGMVSNGGIHSFHEHLYALLELCQREKVEKVFIHAFLDGRDTPFNSGKNFLAKLQQEITKLGVGAVASMSGRFWAMDRDQHWDRTQQAYVAMTDGVADATATDPVRAVEASYAEKVYDEELPPTVIVGAQRKPVATIRDHDAVIFFNFRNDRMRQLTKAFVQEEFTGFSRTKISDLFVVTMTEYEAGLPVRVAFPPEYIENPLAKILADHQMKQLHIAETEKYAHVTFFLNGGNEKPFPGEERVLISSPQVSSFDQKPEMSARLITERVVAALATRAFDCIFVNYANADMVGHTGNLTAISQAVEALDACLGSVVQAALQQNGTVIITADHGNAEEAMNLQTGVINKEHSVNPVPCIIVGKPWERTTPLPPFDLSTVTPTGLLSDVAPTILGILGIPKPPEMTGRSLLPSFP